MLLPGFHPTFALSCARCAFFNHSKILDESCGWHDALRLYSELIANELAQLGKDDLRALRTLSTTQLGNDEAM